MCDPFESSLARPLVRFSRELAIVDKDAPLGIEYDARQRPPAHLRYFARSILGAPGHFDLRLGGLIAAVRDASRGCTSYPLSYFFNESSAHCQGGGEIHTWYPHVRHRSLRQVLFI